MTAARQLTAIANLHSMFASARVVSLASLVADKSEDHGDAAAAKDRADVSALEALIRR